MGLPKCYFIDSVTGEQMFGHPIEMDVPQLGSCIVVAGEKDNWRVISVQHKIGFVNNAPGNKYLYPELRMVNVLLRKVADQ